MKNLAFEHEIASLLDRIQKYLPGANFSRIRKACEFAVFAHGGQIRKSGEPYFIHPLKTAEILTKLHVDEDTLIAAVLHDVPEDTTHTIKEVEEKFGQTIAYLVDGITKLSKVHYRNDMESRQIESLKKLFIHSAEDLRVVIIKLADRLHNMRTLHYIAEEKKRCRIARETLEIYVPIANLLGMSELRSDLEDLCFEILFPEDFRKLQLELEEKKEERHFILDEMIHLTERELAKHHFEAEILGRQKTLYSIFRKFQIKKQLADIDDILAIRLVLPTRKDCYIALGIIHRLFKPKQGTFKDYIAVPKPNGYQSIHSVVYGVDSMPVEYQIRTKYMHLEAEYGIAAHYFYKYSNEEELANLMRQRTSWVKRILEIQRENDNESFLQNLKFDIFQDRIFVFTPRGDVVDLPKGASILDFAYAIHTDIGNRTAEGIINGITYSLSTPLSTGDHVRVVTSKNARPEREWLNAVKTTLAATKIRQSLSKLPFEEKIHIGKRVLKKEFDYLGKNFLEALQPRFIRTLAQHFPIHSLDDLFASVGEGRINPKDILSYLPHPDDEALFFFWKKRGLTNRRKPTFLSRIGLRVLGDNQKGQFREILRILHSLKIPVVKFLVDRPWYFKKDRCYVSILVKNYDELSQVFENLEAIQGITSITRTFFRRKLIFYFWSLVTVAFWATHPFLIDKLYHFSQSKNLPSWLPQILSGLGLFALFGLLFYLHRLTKRSFPEFHETKLFWPTMVIVNTLALATIIGEIITLRIPVSWRIFFFIILAIYALLFAEYFRYRKQQFEE